MIAVVGGPLKTPLEGLLFLIGLLLYLGGSVAAGLAITPERTAGPVLLWGFVGFAAGSVLYVLAEGRAEPGHPQQRRLVLERGAAVAGGGPRRDRLAERAGRPRRASR